MAVIGGRWCWVVRFLCEFEFESDSFTLHILSHRLPLQADGRASHHGRAVPDPATNWQWTRHASFRPALDRRWL